MENRENECKGTRGDANRAMHEAMDPAELWLDESVSPEMLIQLDPLDITRDMVERAEHPELADPLIAGLPDGPINPWAERAWRRAYREQHRDVEAERRLAMKLLGSS